MFGGAVDKEIILLNFGYETSKELRWVAIFMHKNRLKLSVNLGQ